MRLSSHSAFVILALFIFLATGPFQFVSAQNRQLSLADILIALRSKKAEIAEKNRLLAEAVKDRGITFTLTPEIEKELGITGAQRELIDAIRQKTSVVREVAFVPPKPEPKQSPAIVPQATPVPLDFVFYRNRANTYLSNGSLDLAVSDLGKAIEFRPGDAVLYNDRGVTLLKQGKSEAALTDFDKAIELNPKDSSAFFNRGSAFERIGKIDSAISDYKRAAELDAANEPARNAAARLQEARAKLEPKQVPDPPKLAAETSLEQKKIAVGALNGYAKHLAMPVYSQFDRKMGIQGKVTVQITLDENGKVISAQATDGPKSLRSVSEEAAKKSTFKPAMLGDKPAKATGFIIYNFVPAP